jgi:hypothetical protein
MKRLLILALAMVAALIAPEATFAQAFIPPGGSQFNPLNPLNAPPPPPPPPPKIEVPVVPKMDALPSYNFLPAPRPSFGDKITTCLQEGAAAGLGPGDREVYSRSCANSR